MNIRARSALLLGVGTLAVAWTIPAAASQDQAQGTTLTAAQMKAIVCQKHDAGTLAAMKQADAGFQCDAFPAQSPVKHSASPPAKLKLASLNATVPAKANSPAVPTAAKPAAVTTNNVSTCPGFHFLLRDSWSDTGPLWCPTDVKKATGASLSYTDDYVAKNRNWATKGLAGIVFSDVDRIYPGVNPPQWFDRTFAFYVEDNSSYNSNSKLVSKNSDTRTAGFSGELGYINGNDYQYFRATPNVVWDAIKNTTAVAVMGEYIPALSSLGFWTPFHAFGDTLNWQFDPDLKLQYASTTDRKNPMQFSGKSQSFRVGPDLTVLVQPFGTGGDFWSRIGLNTTFHPWYEAYTAHGAYWWTSAVTYRLDDAGNVGLKFTYNRGLDENSGVMTNQYLASLSGRI